MRELLGEFEKNLVFGVDDDEGKKMQFLSLVNEFLTIGVRLLRSQEDNNECVFLPL